MVDDRRHQRPLFDEAVRLAREAELRGNLPIGAVVALDGEIIARGMNAIWHPQLSLTRHAEIVALEAVPVALWDRASEMTLVTTLEPCVMCAGAILLHRIGHVLFGAADPRGGASTSTTDLPPYFADVRAGVKWVGPADPVSCNPLYLRVTEIEARRGASSSPGWGH